jgi:hypothetical protein
MAQIDSKKRSGSWSHFVAPKVTKQELKRSAAQLRTQVTNERRIISTTIAIVERKRAA